MAEGEWIWYEEFGVVGGYSSQSQTDALGILSLSERRDSLQDSPSANMSVTLPTRRVALATRIGTSR